MCNTVVYRYWATSSGGMRSLRTRKQIRRALCLPWYNAWGQPPDCRARVWNQKRVAVLQTCGETFGTVHGSRWIEFAGSKYKRWWNCREGDRWAKGLPESLSECWSARIGENCYGKQRKRQGKEQVMQFLQPAQDWQEFLHRLMRVKDLIEHEASDRPSSDVYFGSGALSGLTTALGWPSQSFRDSLQRMQLLITAYMTENQTVFRRIQQNPETSNIKLMMSWI